ncbi:hypothetical protein C4D60_Mb09t08590 [Musa balbisiana]|uniref:Uncharacterized protein n=1 Tax=Musa balbisiana TaxID=52838 RepID=A0A4S8IFR6_MUSBA|nr:hypothetical protein C4D60_Mb09t08590 [Musa balbisiana]
MNKRTRIYKQQFNLYDQLQHNKLENKPVKDMGYTTHYVPSIRSSEEKVASTTSKSGNGRFNSKLKLWKNTLPPSKNNLHILLLPPS